MKHFAKKLTFHTSIRMFVWKIVFLLLYPLLVSYLFEQVILMPLDYAFGKYSPKSYFLKMICRYWYIAFKIFKKKETVDELPIADIECSPYQ